MKIAVFEPYPRMCGVTTWTWHMAQGFRDLGHDCDVINFTKSGRPRKTSSIRKDGVTFAMGWRWWHEAADVTGKFDDAPSILDTYDLIILNEPKNGTADRDAVRAKELPEYIKSLSRTSTPWMTILHAPQYDPKRSTFIESCLDSGKFTGLAIEHQPGSYESGEWAFAGRITKIQQWPWLPYRMKHVITPTPRYRIVGMSGRMVPNKGPAVLAYYSDQLPENWRTRLHGAESGGNGPAVSYGIYEALARYHGWIGRRVGQKEPKVDEIGNSGDTIHQWPWWLQKNGRVLEYVATYDDPFKIWQECAVAVNLTQKKFAVGLEYTMLEAMNAGCAVVMPAYCFGRTGREQYAAYTLDRYDTTMGISRDYGMRVDSLGEGVGDELVMQLNAACKQFEAGYDPNTNLRALATYHAPKHLAKKILESL